MFLYLLEFLVAIMIAFGFVTQVVIPLFLGTPIFPILQRHGIEAKIELAKQDIRMAEFEKELEILKQTAKETRKEKEEN